MLNFIDFICITYYIFQDLLINDTYVNLGLITQPQLVVPSTSSSSLSARRLRPTLLRRPTAGGAAVVLPSQGRKDRCR